MVLEADNAIEKLRKVMGQRIPPSGCGHDRRNSHEYQRKLFMVRTVPTAAFGSRISLVSSN
jgi:hypothetical protein